MQQTSLYDRLSATALREGPTVLLWLAAALALAPLLFLANLLLAGTDTPAQHLRVLALMVLPAALALALSRALRARHWATVPLTYALCALSVLTLHGGAGDALSGISPQWLLTPMLWLATLLELLAVTFAAGLVTLMWRQGVFRGPTR